MAKVYCPECNKKVSEHAEACPKCGYPIAKNIDKIKKREAFFKIITLILLFGIFIYFQFSSDDKQKEISQNINTNNLSFKKTGEENNQEYETTCMKECFVQIKVRSKDIDEFDGWAEFISRRQALKLKEEKIYDVCKVLGGLLSVALTNSKIKPEARHKAEKEFCKTCYCF